MSARTTIAVNLFVNCTGLLVGYYLPSAAGEGRIRPAVSIFCIFFLRWLPVGLAAISSAILALHKKQQVSMNYHYALGLIAISFAIVYVSVLTPERRDSRFLGAFRQHFEATVGVESAMDTAENIRRLVDSRQLTKPRLSAADFPPNWRTLAKQMPIQGFIGYGPDDKCQQVVAYWGGNFFKWGIEFSFVGRDNASPLQKRKVLTVTTNVSYFIER